MPLLKAISPMHRIPLEILLVLGLVANGLIGQGYCESDQGDKLFPPPASIEMTATPDPTYGLRKMPTNAPLALVKSEISLAARVDLTRAMDEKGMFPTRRIISIAAADLDGDNASDLVVANAGPDAHGQYNVTIFYGDGSGGFAASQDLPLKSNPVKVMIADINRDGFLDILAAVGSPDNSIAVWLGNGSRSFADPPWESAVQARPSDLIITDLDGDEIPDLAITIESLGQLRILWGQGNGLFSTPIVLTTRPNPIAVVAADFNQDGLMDIVVLSRSETSGSLSLLESDGKGDFQTAYVLPVSGRVQAMAAYAAADGKRTDLAVGVIENLGPGDEGRIKVFANLDKQPFYDERQSLSTALNPVAILPIDFDGDGQVDLVVALDRSQSATIYYGDGAGQFIPNVTLFPVGGTPHSLATGFFNEEPYLDLAVANTPTPNIDRGNISILRGTAEGGLFQPASPDVEEGFRNGDTPSNPRALASGDFNRDGFLDLAVANMSHHTISILAGNGLGNFQARQSLPVLCPPPQGPCQPGPLALVAGDFNGDAFLDLVALNGSADFVSFFAGTDTGEFVAENQIITEFPSGNGLRRAAAMAIGDFNGDGHLDLAIVGRETSDLVILEGLGDGYFVVRTYSELGPARNATAILAQDLDNDNIIDLAILADPMTDAGELWILRGMGNGQFCRAGLMGDRLCCADVGCSDFNPIRLTGQIGAGGIAAGRFSPDNQLYIAVTNFESRSLSILKVMDGRFTVVQTALLPGKPAAVLAVDLDGDGDPEFVTVNQTSNNVTVLRKSGETFDLSLVDWGVGVFPRSIIAGQFNGDNRLDLAVGNWGNDTVTILLNQSK
ncbi:MAG: VCBS repeat-containing protein [Acidobacteria bacterium]|nr:VCBS repeat-containing protein [Acidobacteriota bacterium]MBI3655604.1 VCBS repeat-containing protein [Acidobacteriota bacterium]